MDAAVIASLAILVGFLVLRHEAEREAWAQERRELVNVAISRHAGEVAVLNHTPAKKAEPEPEAEPGWSTVGAGE